MKQTLLLSLLIVFTGSSMGQAPGFSDIILYAGQSFDNANSINVDQNGNYYITAYSQNPLSNSAVNEPPPINCNFIQPVSNTLYNGVLFRYDSGRNLNLSLTIQNSTLGETVIDSSGNMYISGVLQYGASRDAFIKKYSPSGVLLWSKLVQSNSSGRSEDDVITSLKMFKDSSMIIVGFSYGNSVSVFGQFVAGPSNFISKLNPDGNVVWIKSFSSSLGVGAYKARFDEKGDILIAGNENVAGSSNAAALIAKLSNLTGEVIWKKQFHSTGNYTASVNGIGVAKDFYMFSGAFGGQIKIGDSLVVSSGGLDIFLVQCDTAGNIKWVKKAGSTGRDIISDILTDERGTTFLAGSFSDDFLYNGTSYTSEGNTDVLVAAIDSTGRALWTLTGGSNIPGHIDDLFYNEWAAAIAVDSKKQIQVVGTTVGSGNFGGLTYRASEEIRQNGYWLTLGGKASNYTVVYPCNGTSTADSAFIININPNPFTDYIVISNSMNETVDYTVHIYNSLGQQIGGKFFRNSSSVTVTDWNNIASGIYFISISTKTAQKTVKLIKK